MLSPAFLRYAGRGAVLAVLLLCRAAFCQWLNYPTPGIPRSPGGKPNLNTPAPRTADDKPDLSGLWFLAPSVEIFRNSRANNLKPWAQAVVNQNIENWGRNDPSTFKCLPRGPGALFGALPAAGWTQIVQTPGTHRAPLCRSHVSPHFHRWAGVRKRSESELHGLLGRPLGRRHSGRG